MRAVFYEQPGPAQDVLEVGDMADPEPGASEVRVRVSASGVNPVDVKRRAGARGGGVEERIIPHFDGAGVIDAVGDGVSADCVGERVWLFEGQWQRPSGTAAELIVLPSDRAVPLPATTSFEEGAGLGIPALTAHRAVFADGTVTGQDVLVTGGAGDVSRYAIQFAKIDGARVIATVSSDEKAELARAAGADETIDYRREDVAARIADFTDGGGVDRIVEVEFGGNLATSQKILKPNGVVAAYASDAVLEPAFPFYPLLYAGMTIRLVLVFTMPDEAKQRAVRDITGWLNEGRLRHHVGASFDMADAAAAHQAVEGGTIGKVVLNISAS